MSDHPDRPRFEAWVIRDFRGKSKNPYGYLARNPDGSYVHLGAAARWAAWREALCLYGKGRPGALMYPLPFVSMPLQPHDLVLEAMEDSGARKGWAADIYRSALQAQTEIGLAHETLKDGIVDRMPKIEGMSYPRTKTRPNARQRESNRAKIAELEEKVRQLLEERNGADKT